MAHSQLIRSNVAGLHYVYTLAAAYRRYSWIVDPDYASASDQEAWEKIRRDAVFAHAIAKRRAAVAGLSWRIVPRSNAPEDVRAADLLRDLVAETRRFWHARFNLAQAVFRGSAYAYVDGGYRELALADDEPRRWWVARELRDVDRRRFRLERDPDVLEPEIKLRWTMFHVGKNDWVPLARPEWFVRANYESTEDTLGYSRGLLQSIYFFWRAKAEVLTQGLEGLERWAQGLLKVGVDSMRPGATDRDNATMAQEYIDVLNRHRSQHVLVHAKEDEIEVVSGPGQGWELTRFFLEYLDHAVERLCLSSLLPTGGGSAREGSYARADVEQEEMKETFAQDRQQLAEDLDVGFVDLLWRVNAESFAAANAAAGLPPGRRGRFEIWEPVVEDPIKRAQSAQILVSMGVPILRAELYDRTGWTAPKDGEETIGGQQAGGAGFPPTAGTEAAGPSVAPQAAGAAPETATEAEGGSVAFRVGETVWYDAGGPVSAAGQPCKPGQSAALTGCKPAGDAPGGEKKPVGAVRRAVAAGKTVLGMPTKGLENLVVSGVPGVAAFARGALEVMGRSKDLVVKIEHAAAASLQREGFSEMNAGRIMKGMLGAKFGGGPIQLTALAIGGPAAYGAVSASVVGPLADAALVFLGAKYGSRAVKAAGALLRRVRGGGEKPKPKRATRTGFLQQPEPARA